MADGAWRDNVLVERLWQAIKYEEVCLRAYTSFSEARASIGRDIVFCNTVRRRTRTNGVCLAHPAFIA